jgi:hypothetical protein
MLIFLPDRQLLVLGVDALAATPFSVVNRTRHVALSLK